LAGVYACAGHEFGVVAGAGGLTLNTSGVAVFQDYYGQVQTGAWAVGSQANELVFQGFDLVSATYDPTNKLLRVVLKPASKITHTADHQMECSLATPPSTATVVPGTPEATPTIVAARLPTLPVDLSPERL
jgi:hypothetical protein